MRFIMITLALFASIVLFIFCKNTKYNADNMPKSQIRFGKGGGFTGIEQMYILLENGQLFEKGTDGNWKSLESARKKTVQSYFKSVEKAKLADLKFQYPGNTYSFIEVPQGDGFNRISWGSPQHPVDSTVQDLFHQLLSLTKPKQ